MDLNNTPPGSPSDSPPGLGELLPSGSTPDSPPGLGELIPPEVFADFFFSSSNRQITEATIGVVANLGTVLTGIVEEEQQQAESSRQRRARVHRDRDRERAHEELMAQYFNDDRLYSRYHFERRFRMSKRLFLKIVTDLEGKYTYFEQKRDGTGRLGFSPIQKCTAALRHLAYGTVPDALDEYLKMSERTARESVEHFCKGIIELYRPQYLRKPTEADIHLIYALHQRKHGFPGMLGSIDCMHWAWGNCPTAWRGGYTSGYHGGPSISLQAVASQDLWIWHAYFGEQGTNNDINVFEASPLLEQILSGLTPTVGFSVNDTHYERGYFLGDGIYPEYSIFVKTFGQAVDEKRLFFKTRQEAARKDVERAFGVLKKRFAIVANPCRYFDEQKMKIVMYACIILHNMILEDEGEAKCCQAYDPEDPTLTKEYWTQETSVQTRYQAIHSVRNREIHNMLKADLVEHLWANRNRVPQPEPQTVSNYLDAN